MTPAQSREISRATRRICSADGYGHQVVVFGNGDWLESVDSNDIIARKDPAGKPEPVMLRIKVPTSESEVQQMWKERQETR